MKKTINKKNTKEKNKKNKTEDNKKSIKKNNKLTIIIATIQIIIIIIILSLPIKIVIPDDNKELEIIGEVEGRDVYSYSISKVIFIPPFDAISTNQLLKGTIKNGIIWDGGTTIYQGTGYIIIDCTDNLREPRQSPIIITTKSNEEEVVNTYCHSY